MIAAMDIAEAVGGGLPKFDAVRALTLMVGTVDAVDGGVPYSVGSTGLEACNLLKGDDAGIPPPRGSRQAYGRRAHR